MSCALDQPACSAVLLATGSSRRSNLGHVPSAVLIILISSTSESRYVTKTGYKHGYESVHTTSFLPH